MTDERLFLGHKKHGVALSTFLERPMQIALAKLVPRFIETYHLTAMTVLWSAGIVGFGYLAKFDIQWLWCTSLMIVLQYFTDLVDGEVGRQRGTGLIKWGYYMDHFLDFVFLCSLLIGYFFILPVEFIYLHFFLLAIGGAFMVNSFLAFTTLNRFQVAYYGIGPTECRLGFIIINALLALFGTTHMGQLLPYILVLAFIGLCITVYHTQKQIWAIDMETKKTTDDTAAGNGHSHV